MPTAVFSSLICGICAVIEIHYSFDYSYLYWSEKWTFAAADVSPPAWLINIYLRPWPWCFYTQVTP